MSLWGKLFGGNRLPKMWDEIPRFRIVIPFTLAQRLLLREAGLTALAFRSELENVIPAYFPDKVFEAIHRKRSQGLSLTPEETVAVNSHDSWHENLLAEKFGVVFLFEGNWRSLPLDQRDSLRAETQIPNAELYGYGEEYILSGSALKHLAADPEEKIAVLDPSNLIDSRDVPRLLRRTIRAFSSGRLMNTNNLLYLNRM